MADPKNQETDATMVIKKREATEAGSGQPQESEEGPGLETVIAVPSKSASSGEETRAEVPAGSATGGAVDRDFRDDPPTLAAMKTNRRDESTTPDAAEINVPDEPVTEVIAGPPPLTPAGVPTKIRTGGSAGASHRNLCRKAAPRRLASPTSPCVRISHPPFHAFNKKQCPVRREAKLLWFLPSSCSWPWGVLRCFILDRPTWHSACPHGFRSREVRTRRNNPLRAFLPGAARRRRFLRPLPVPHRPDSWRSDTTCSDTTCSDTTGPATACPAVLANGRRAGLSSV